MTETAAVRTASEAFIHPRTDSSSGFAASQSASGIAGLITTGAKFKPTRSMPRWCWTAASSGAPSTPIIRRPIGARIPKPPSATDSGSLISNAASRL